MTEPLIDVRGVSVRFGGLTAVSDVSFTISPGEVVGLMGPNGAGKSTLFNAVTGVVRATAGEVFLFGQDMTRAPAHARMRLGVSRTFQLGGLIPGLTVLENVVLGLDHRQRIQGRRFRLPGRGDLVREARATLEELSLSEVADAEATSLGSGTQRAVEVARCVASGARLMLLDEPAVGLTPEERELLKSLVRRLAQTGISVLLTDHDTDIVFGASDRIFVLNQGAVIATGAADEVRQNPEVALAYLGAKREEGDDGGLRRSDGRRSFG
jgi:ABC-type branched-subunit amino acid transport system ATPase component